MSTGIRLKPDSLDDGAAAELWIAPTLMRLSPLRLRLGRQLRETFGYSVVKDRPIDVIPAREEEIRPMLAPPFEVRLAARRPTERLMRAHALEWLRAIPAQNAFCGAIGDRAIGVGRG